MLEDGYTSISHTLASSHFMLTKRGSATEETFKLRRADETLVGDIMLVSCGTDGGSTSQGTIIAKQSCTVSQAELI